MRANAQREMRASPRLNRAQPNAWNMLRVIFAQERKTTCASRLWHEMVRDLPDYEPARANLAILGGQSELPARRDGGRSLFRSDHRESQQR
jgi:hypothetical protein